MVIYKRVKRDNLKFKSVKPIEAERLVSYDKERNVCSNRQWSDY